MGPTQEALALADFLIGRFGLTVDRYLLAYALMEHIEREFGAELDAEPTTPQPSADAVREVIGSMRNFADVADKCELTEGNAQVAIRAWATQLESLLSGGSHA